MPAWRQALMQIALNREIMYRCLFKAVKLLTSKDIILQDAMQVSVEFYSLIIAQAFIT
jgi:hypothetical protein